ncbi:MAG: MBL fold metallo-hydrolase [Methanomassiliicoccus sp.]|nr:MBL fold metallo-hydrolase [Methanomassiliicoccus sp.]
MKIEILGTRGHIEVSAPGHELHSGVLMDDVLFDLGERRYLERLPRAVFITHFHEDHAFFVSDSVKIDVPVFAPERLAGWNVRIVRSTVEVAGMRVTPVPTNHSERVRSCGYLVEKDMQRVLYTGDLFSIQERYRDRLSDLDLVITEGSFMRRGGLVRRDPETGRYHGHTGIPDLVQFFSPLARRIVITHLGSWFFKDIQAAVRQIESLDVEARVTVAEDGTVIHLDLEA